jgi:hypothetical protein
MKTAEIPQIPRDAFCVLRFPDDGFDCVITPYNARATAALRRKAKENGHSLGEQLREEILISLAVGRPEDLPQNI